MNANKAGAADIIIVVEGPRDERFVQGALGAMFPSLVPMVIVSDGKARLPVVASTAVSVGRKPVLVVMDADTTNEDDAAHERLDLLAEIQASRRPGEVEVVMATPCLDPAAFLPPSNLQRLVGRALTSSELALAKHAPKAFWATLGADDDIARLGAADYEAMSGLTLFDAVRRLCERREAATAP